MADKYDKDGIFPVDAVLSSDGKFWKKWKASTGIPDEFTRQLKAIVDAHNSSAKIAPSLTNR